MGDDVVVRYGKEEDYPKIERIPSGSYKLDSILGGGWPVGRITEIMGWESAGKTTLALEAVASMQRITEKNAFALFVDTEHSVDFSYAAKLGVDMSKVYFSQPSGADIALKIMYESVKEGAHRLIILDSIAALTTRAQLESNAGDSSAKADVARLLGVELRKINSYLANANCTLIMLNQMRVAPGVMFGNPEYSPGGNAPKFYASIRLMLKKKGKPNEEKGSDDAVSSTTSAKTQKNKTFPPFRDCEFDIRYGSGIDKVAEMLDKALELGIFGKKGSWYYANGKQLANGKDGMIKYLQDKQDKLRKQIHKKLTS